MKLLTIMTQAEQIENRIISLTIGGISDTCTLSANYDEGKGRYYMPALSLKDELKEVDEFWDNSYYLFGELHNNLISGIFTDDDISLRTYLMTHREELLSLLEKGKELGWHKL